MNKTIVVAFEEDECKREKRGLVQWDRGATLKIYGINTKYDVQLHFSLNSTCGDAIPVETTKEGDAIIAKIPQFILEGTTNTKYQSKYNAYAFIYLYDAESAETVRKIIFEIQTRPKPADYIHSPDEKKTWDKLSENIDKLKEETVKSVNGLEPDENGNIEVDGKFVVTITPKEDGSGYVADKTFDEIVEAHNSGKIVIARYYQMEDDISSQRYGELMISSITNTLVGFNISRSYGGLQISIFKNNNIVISDKEFINKPTVGKIGQFLAVKTVNSAGTEGEPYLFECVDPPEGFSGSWNDLDDKPFYKTEKVLLDEYVTGSADLSEPLELNKKYKVTYDYGGVVEEYVESYLYEDGDIRIQCKNCKVQDSNWFRFVNNEDEGHVKIVEITIATLSEEFIPTNIPKIQSATVGQTIVVKEVDENGKPTEWECVDVGDLLIKITVPDTIVSGKVSLDEAIYMGDVRLAMIKGKNVKVLLHTEYAEDMYGESWGVDGKCWILYPHHINDNFSAPNTYLYFRDIANTYQATCYLDGTWEIDVLTE